MSDRTLLYLTDDAGTHLQLWQRSGHDQPRLLGEGTWDQADVLSALSAVARRGDALWIVMPASWGSLLSVPIPSRRREQALQALPFAIEDLVTDAVEDLHLTLGATPTRTETGYLWPVLVVDRARRESLLAQLDEIGLRPQGMVHPLDLWPQPDARQWQVYALGDGMPLQVVTGRHTGFVLPASNDPWSQLANVLPGSDADTQGPERLMVAGLPNPSLNMGELSVEQTPRPDWPVLWHDGIERAQPLSAVEPVDAGQRRRQRWLWLWVAVLLVLLGVTLTVQQGIEGWQAAKHSKELQVQIRKDFHAALPDVHRLVNARVQIEQALAAQGDSADRTVFLSAMQALSKSLHDGQAKDASIRLAHVRFAQGRLVADLTGKQYDVLKDMLASLQKQSGWSVERIDSGVEGAQAHMRLGMSPNAMGGAQ